MFWLAVPAIAAVIFAALYFRDRQNLKRAAQELREINASGSSRRLRISMPGREMEALAREVNRALDEKQLSEIAHRRVEKERRDEIANISHDLRTVSYTHLDVYKRQGQGASHHLLPASWRAQRDVRGRGGHHYPQRTGV